MRKIETLEEIDRRKKRNTLIISSVILVTLVFGTAGYAFLFSGGLPSSDSNSNTEGITGDVTNIGGRYSVTFQGQTLSFSSSPDSLKEIPVNISTNLNGFAGKILYIDSDNNAVSQEIASALSRYSPRIQRACYGECEEDLPEKDCSENLIIWSDSAENKVYQEDNCIFIEGDMKAVDAFLYALFGFL